MTDVGALRPVLAAAAIGYLFGSIPFGLLLARLAGLGDIRNIGSGNIGATNVLRTGKKGAAALTLLLDGGKGALAVILAASLGETAALVAGACAVAGHVFPVWLRFKGGKGVATGLGVLLAAAPLAGMLAGATWALAAAITRSASVASIAFAFLAPVFAFALYDPRRAFLAAAIGLMVIFRHRANVARLFAGTEPRIGEKG